MTGRKLALPGATDTEHHHHQQQQVQVNGGVTDMTSGGDIVQPGRASPGAAAEALLQRQL